MARDQEAQTSLARLETVAAEWITDETLRDKMADAFTAAHRAMQGKADPDRRGVGFTTFHGKKEIVRNVPDVPEDERRRGLGLLEVARDIAVLGAQVDVEQAIVDIGEGKSYSSGSAIGGSGGNEMRR